MAVVAWPDWRRALVHPDACLGEAAAAADRGRQHIAFIVDGEERLLGILTDGDLRRAQLGGVPADQNALAHANRQPVVDIPGRTPVDYARILREHNITHLPLTESGRLVGAIVRHVPAIDGAGTWAMVMAGGFGKRLAPLTDTTPKPLLPVGGIPMLERIIRSLAHAGLRTIVLSVFHMADHIRAFCGDGSRWGVRIIYVQEEAPRGTAGALALLDERPAERLLVLNGDILTNLPFATLINYHVQQGHVATMCVCEQSYQLQYGVVRFDGPYVVDIDEKPIHSCFVNAGVYVLDTSVLDLIPNNQYFDMPSLFRKLVESDMRPGAFPIRELWLDIGSLADYEKAQQLVTVHADGGGPRSDA